MIPLPVGAIAPEFVSANERGEPVTLSDLLRSGHLLVIFYPADWGFICTNEVVEFRDRQLDFEQAGIDLIGISTNTATSHGYWSERLRLKFPLLSDPPGNVAAAYGVLDTNEDSFNKGRSKRALFLVDRDGMIRYTWLTENPWLEPDYDLVLTECIKALQPSPAKKAGNIDQIKDTGTV